MFVAVLLRRILTQKETKPLSRVLSSLRLTAYVAKVFVMASNLVALDSKVNCNVVEFLILNAQRPEGLFNEVGSVYHGEMIGDVSGTDSDASMTAFCLITLQESRTICAATIDRLQDSINEAVSYLEKHLANLTNPYAVAMTSYALANENKMNREILHKFVSPDSSHWPVPKGEQYTLEATAYALLALVKVKAFEDAKPVVRWFSQQQKVGGSYGSTQVTGFIYLDFTGAVLLNRSMNVDILLPGRSKPEKHYFNRKNHYTTRTSKVRTSSVGLNFLCRHKNRRHKVTMTILDINLLTGFTVDTQDLDSLSKGHEHIISKYELNTEVSERGLLIIYLDKVSHRRPEVISFRIHQKLKVGVLQPAAVSVYEYYQPTPCVKFYHPEKTDGKLLRLCRNDECICAEVGRILNCCIFITGGHDVGSRAKQQPFLSYQHCRETLDLSRGKTYLMSSSKDIYTDDTSQSYQYVLTERTWIEYWPTESECNSDEHRRTCSGIEEMAQQYLNSGC
uniref:NTR domain-containing protein n=1 Tax=Anabas testudineus TaxID=64144 RepID=A0A3Q1I2L2_ANATE